MLDKVLIVSNDPEFEAELLRCWQRAGSVPMHEVAGPDSPAGVPVSCVAVLDGMEALSRLRGEGSLVVAVTNGGPIAEAECAGRRVVQLQRATAWADTAAVLALDCVLREQALRQVDELTKQLRSVERYTVLGKFISGQQHELANALTSLLGHTELLMTDREVPDEVQRKIGTIYAMSLRIHDVLQGLSSLDREMLGAERQALKNKPAAGTASQ